MPAVKLNVSLDRATAEKLRRRAREAGKPTSQYLAALVEEDDRRSQDALAAEGYRLLSGESRTLVDEAWAIAAEGLPDWQEEAADGAEATQR